MATVSKTKDSGRGGGGGGGWRRGITPAFCISCFLLGGPACQKKEGRDGGTERRREKHLTRHIEKKRALNAIKARGEISH